MRYRPSVPAVWVFLALALVNRDSCPAGEGPTASDHKSDFVSLFDGKTLNGWRQITGKPEVWIVERGSFCLLYTSPSPRD